MKKKLFYILIIIILSINGYSQFSKTHYIPPLAGSSSIFPGQQFLYISTPTTTPVNFKIIELGGNVITGTVSKNAPYIHNIGFGGNSQMYINSNISSAVFSNKGFIVEAEDMVYVTVRVIDTTSNHAGLLVSKGRASLGNRFRVGALTNVDVQSYIDIHATFISVLATENNTTVNFSGIKPGVVINNNPNGSTPFSVVLNSGESYAIVVQGPNNANRDGLIGSLVTSDKPIALNCGSFGGSNAVANLDLGFDQIVPAERINTNEYIFIKSTGINSVEKVILVADEDGTEITLNGEATPSFTINAGQYVAINGNRFDVNGNLYINSNKRVFAYQSIGDNSSPDQRNQELFFVPPLSCQTPRIIDNIPQINLVGNRQFNGRVTIVTKTGSTLGFTVNNNNYTAQTLPFNIVGPRPVTGNPNYETYIITGLSGNFSVSSTSEIYLAAYGSEQAATFGGFYSGFTFEPEISFTKLDLAQDSCIPNTRLSVNTLSPFDTFQWYFNNTLITGATDNFLLPSLPGYYKVSATISGCGLPVESNNIPVSSCSIDSDGDGVNNNIDLDNDNDGLTNCQESYGNVNFNFNNSPVGSIQIQDYLNNYQETVTTDGTATPSAIPFLGDANGNFVTEAATGKGNSVNYTANFNIPISLAIEYASILTNPNDALSQDSEITIACPVDKTITILNPDNQLLIDTNFDGVFESGVTQYSSFEIRFRLNNGVFLTPQNSTFSIKANLINSISITNTNLTDDNTSRVALKLIATCVPKDSDGDGIPDQNDYDSDNDSIPDYYESQGANFIAKSNIDANNDGIDDAFGTGITAVDSDGDGVPDYLDLDSDNDGIFDIIESGSTGNQNNTSGIMVGNFGTNGLHNSLETSPNSGIINYTLADSDNDGIWNYIEIDSDDDGCFDTIEAGYEDNNNDGILGSDTPTNIVNGLVISNSGYSIPNQNYTIGAPISITSHPEDVTTCELQNATFTIDSPVVDSYQWQVSTDNGLNWNIITNSTTYSGATTASLTVSNVSPTMAGYQYRSFINRNGNSCGLYSNAATLTTYALPVVTTPITLRQCDVDSDGISDFNLTQINDLMTANVENETITYYTSQNAADQEVSIQEIIDPIVYTSGTSTVFARIENANGCYSIVQINLVVSVSQIPPSFVILDIHKCDDYLDSTHDDRDGIASFNFTTIKNNLQNILPSTITISFYKNEADFLAETDADGNSLAISDIANYRNIDYPNLQTIWVRADSSIDNSCFGFKTFDIIVEALPVAHDVNPLNEIRHCDDDQDGIYGFDTTGIEAAVLNGQTNVNMLYTRGNGTQSTTLPNPLFVNQNEIITVRVINNVTPNLTEKCFDEVQLEFIVDDLPQAFAVPVAATTYCDDEADPLYQDGIVDFDTTDFETLILGGQTNMNVYYFDENNNPLPSPLLNPFRSGTQNVRVVVENSINTDCTAEVILPFIVNPLSIIDINERVLICYPNTQATFDAHILDGTPITDYTYQWYLNGNILVGKTSYSITVPTPGNYSVTVTNNTGCVMTRKVEVAVSQAPIFENLFIEDLTNINTILVNVNGSGNYEYALNDIAGPYQSSNFFNQVPFGIHQVYIRDIEGCATIGPIQATVLGIPKYFTPNGDGFHDFWNVKGVSLQSNSRSIIYIFDRYGKLLAQINPISFGWDGTYNGHKMPADDYWYSIQFEDGRSAKGHFALKR
jgi:gliding motility-associated-like protein